MKKIIVTVLGLLALNSVAHADIAGYKKVPTDQQHAYAEAIILANDGDKEFGMCGIDANDLLSTIIYIQEQSNQPLIVLETARFGGAVQRIILTSDASLKKITGGTYEQYFWRNVNHGDLVHPNMVKELVKTASGSCVTGN